MSGHFDDCMTRPADDADACLYCRVVRDEPCSQFIPRTIAVERCANLQAQRPADPRIQIGPTDV